MANISTFKRSPDLQIAYKILFFTREHMYIYFNLKKIKISYMICIPIGIIYQYHIITYIIFNFLMELIEISKLKIVEI